MKLGGIHRRVSGHAVTSGAAAVIVGGMIAAAVLAPWLAPYDPRAVSGPAVQAPAPGHWLGTGDLGQDLLSVLLHGARTSLLVGFAAGVCSTALAGTAGILAALSPRVRAPLMMLIDALLAIPNLPLIVLVVALVGPALPQIVIVLVLVSWPAYARVVRAQVQRVMRSEFVAAAEALGAPTARIVRTSLLPEIAPVLSTKLLLTVRWAILMEAALALLGLGDPGRVSWGMMLQNAYSYPLLFVGGSWAWWALPPALAVALLTLALAVIGRDFEMWLNPLSSAGGGAPRDHRRSRAAASTGGDALPERRRAAGAS